MRKLTTLCLALLIGLSTAFAVTLSRVNPAAPAVSLRSGGAKAPESLQRPGKRSAFPYSGASVSRLGSPISSMRVGPSGSTIYGWLGYTEKAAAAYGLFEVAATNGQYTGPLCNNDQLAASTGFVRAGKLYVYASLNYMGMLMGNSILVYDLTTFELENTIDLSIADCSQLVQSCAYDPASDNVYGYCNTADGTGFQFFCSPANNLTSFKYAATSDMCLSLTCNQTNGKLVGVTRQTANLVEINPATGAMTVIKKAPATPAYLCGMCYSPVDKAYYWNANATSTSALYKISDDYSFTKVCDYPYLEEFMFLATPDLRAVDPKAPAAPQIVNVLLGTEEPNAVFFYDIPSTTFDGMPATGSFDYKAEIDGKPYHDGTVAAGTKNWNLNYVADKDGQYTFTLTLSQNGKEGPSVSRSMYVGNDTPLAPTNVVLTETGVTWDAVTAGVHDGVVNPDALTYTVSVDGKEVATGVKDTHIDYTLPDGELAMHRASVVAVCNGYTSAPGLSEGIIAGNPLSLPASITPTADQWALCSVIDANADGRSFIFTPDQYYNNAFCYIYAQQNSGDDWVILPAMTFADADAYYRVALQAMSSDAAFAEKFEIYVGTAPTAAGMTQCVLPATEAALGTYSKHNALFKVPAAGTYYVGLHAVSPAEGYYLYLRDILVEKTDITATAPGVVTDLKAEGVGGGQLAAKVSFSMPATSVDGATLAADEALTATLKTAAGTATVEGKPGQAVSGQVATLQGDNEITVTVSCAHGTGNAAYTSVFTGVDRPSTVQNIAVSASKDDLTLHLTWEAPAEVGETGGYCPSTGIDYYIASYDSQMGWSLGDKVGTDITSYDVFLGEDAPQTLYRYGIVTGNAAGMSSYVASASCVAGKPYTMPFAESFTTDGGALFGPITVMKPDENYNMLWAVNDPGLLGAAFSYGGKFALIGCSEDDFSTRGLLSAAKVSTLGSKNAKVAMTFFNGLGAYIEILVAGYDDMEPVSIGSTRTFGADALPVGYNEVLLDLPAKYQNREWVQIYIRAMVGSGSEAAIIPTFGIREQFDTDLAVSLDVPSSITLESTRTVKAIVKNNGTEPAALRAGRWTLKRADGRIISTQDTPDGDILQPGESTELTLKVKPEIEYGQRPVVEFALSTPDENTANDSASTTFWVYTGEDPIVLDLRGIDAGEGYIDLAWTEPAIGKYTASFEDEPLYEELPAFIGDFQNIDRDDFQVYGVDPSLPYTIKAAFTVWSVKDCNQRYGAEVFAPYQGDHFLVAFSPLTNPVTGEITPADDWLISPEVEGGSTVSFGMCAMSYEFEETIEVLYSTTDDAIDSFQHLNYYKTSTGLWEDVKLTLPDDAKYFAIRYVSVDCLAVMIDAISYQGAVGEYKVVAYDIIRDGDVIAPAAKAAGEYRDATVTDPDAFYAYNVVPILGNGQKGRKSNTAYVQISGVNEITGASTLVYSTPGALHATGFDGQSLSLYSLDGALLAARTASAHETFRLPAGIYLLKAGDKTHKVIVK